MKILVSAGSKMDFREKKLYHQIHPFKLTTDIGVTPIFLFFQWQHRIAPAIIVGFVPPILVSAAMMIWPPDLERMKNSPLGNYISKYMTSTIEAIRLLSLVSMAWGAWIHNLWLIALGFLILLLAWCTGLFFPGAVETWGAAHCRNGGEPCGPSGSRPSRGQTGKN